LLDRGRNDGDTTSDEGNTLNSTVLDRARKWILHYNIQHLHGPEEVAYDTDELIVLCLLRDGRAYVRSFVEHYLSLGARHIFFLDNGSTDGTVEVAREYENVTVLRSDLPFKVYQVTMKQYLIERFARGRWSLCVDIDEFFDYPYSDVVSLNSFLSYLNDRSYTAVVTQMLDMFPEKPISDNAEPGSSIADDKGEFIKEVHKFYDVTSVRAYKYSRYGRICGRGNSLANAEIAVYKGGIKGTVFGFDPILTKHALVFLDDRIRPLDGNVHKTSNARVADLSCVLFHYKFLDNLYEFVRQAVRRENYMRGSGKHKRWMRTLVQNRSLHLKGETSRQCQPSLARSAAQAGRGLFRDQGGG
jgi:glycosyltransferase involved in cell wall biosynthesis